jgi:glucose/arabinose dehydrogenase
MILGALVFCASATGAQEATPVANTEGLTLIASGLSNPRGFTWSPDGTL